MPFAALCVGLLLLSACQTPPEPASPAAPQAATPLPGPPEAPAARYVIRSDLSEASFLVYRAGLLAHLGHNHVIQATTITGEVNLARDFQRSHFSLAMPVADFRVDAPLARALAGADFAATPDAAAIGGTVRNMLGARVLDAANFPRLTAQSIGLAGPASSPAVTVRITLRGAQRDIVVPVAIDYRDRQIAATASFAIRQTDFGITPFSVLGGALQVADVVTVRLRIVAQPTPTQP